MNTDSGKKDDIGLQAHEFSNTWVGKVSYWIFHLRKPLLVLFILITIALAYSASHLRVGAGFTKMIPLKHEYMQTLSLIHISEPTRPY